MAGTNQYVQVAPDSTGKKIRNLEVTVIQLDGTMATVEMQVVAIAREDGSQVDLDTRWDELVMLSKLQVKLLSILADVDNPLEDLEED